MAGRFLRAGVLIAAAVAFVLTLNFAVADPPGNNGTIKIDGEPFDIHPNNEPHVGCVFQVDFYGYDEGDYWADVVFQAQPPTGTGSLAAEPEQVFIGEDPAGGGTDLDAEQTYDLSAALESYDPHPQQGYHVKLTIHADGSIGADVKHKVFWVSGCAGAGGGPGGGGGGGAGGGGAGGAGGGGAPAAGAAQAVAGQPAFTG